MIEALDSVTGIVTGLRKVPREPGAPNIFNVTVRMADTSVYFGLPCNERNGGAGLTEDEALRAALGEGIERYCASAIDTTVMLTGSVADLERDGYHPLRPDELALFADFQWADLPFAVFTEDTTLSWIGGTSLVDRRVRYVPACLVHIPYRPISHAETTIGPSISTGLACGPDWKTAVIGGLYEVIERDAFAILWRNRIAAPRLVLDDTTIRPIFDVRFARPGLRYHLFFLRFDIGVPTVVSIIEDRNFEPPVFCLGGSARLSPTQGALKALVESVQGWTWARQERLQHGRLERPASFQYIHEFDARVTLYACADMGEAFDFLMESDRFVSLSALCAAGRAADEEVDALVREVAKTGSDVIAIDLTTPDIADLGLCVVKILCPLLEQVEGDNRFPLLGGPRWRTVPVVTGDRQRPLAPAEINPYPHPYP